MLVDKNTLKVYQTSYKKKKGIIITIKLQQTTEKEWLRK